MPRGRPRNTTAGAPAVARRRANNRPQVPFVDKLVLHQWLLSLFNVKRFEDLAEHLRNEAFAMELSSRGVMDEADFVTKLQTIAYE